MKREFIFLGPPACGKGTQTSHLAEFLNLPHVDTGSLLRFNMKNQTPDGIIAKSYVEKGALVPVEVVAKIIKNRLSEDDCKNGYILDGFPRSVEQAGYLEQMNKEIDKNTEAKFIAVYFDIDSSILIDRIVNRRSCEKCGKIFNLNINKIDKCEICGGNLIQRADDTPEIAKNRFETYDKETSPLVEYYENKGTLRKIDANGDINTVWERLLKVVD